MKKRQKQKRSRDEIIRLYEAYIPVVTEKIVKTEMADDGKVTLFVENKGVMNRIFQKIAHKPKYSQIHLDEMGSFIFQRIDGQRTVGQIAELVKAEFGQEAEPLYDRLVKYMQILRNNGFIRFAGKERK